MNLYAFVKNRPVNAIDKLGLLGHRIFSNAGDKEYYSCNCGWIDNSHSDPSHELYEKLIDAIDKFEHNRANDTFTIKWGTAGGAFAQVSYTLTFDESFLDFESKLDLALDIFFDYQIIFEDFQGALTNGGLLLNPHSVLMICHRIFLVLWKPQAKYESKQYVQSLLPTTLQECFIMGRAKKKLFS